MTEQDSGAGARDAAMWKYVLIFGLMNAAWSMMWNLYGTYVPIYLQSGNPDFSNKMQSSGFGLSPMWTSVFMSIDEAFGMLLGPLIGILSDRARRRVPFVIGAVALAVVGVASLPFIVAAMPADKTGRFPELFGYFVAFFVAALFVIVGHASINAPDSCLKMELVPSAARSKILGFISAIGVLLTLALLASAPPLYRLNPKLPFLASAVIAVAAALAYKLFLHEPEGLSSGGDNDAELGFLGKFRSLLPEEKKSLLLMLLCWFLGGMGVNSTTTFASSYAVNILGMGEADTMYLVVACLAGSFIAYIPAGYLASRLGRFPLLRFGMLGLSACGLAIFFFPVKAVVFAAVFALGIFAATITVTILPILSDIVTSQKMMGSIAGAFVFVGLANAIVGNLVCGGAIQATGSYKALWLVVCAGGLGGFLTAALPKLGEGPGKKDVQGATSGERS